uniref:Odorant receptor n=1 Tax=Eucryptorrhynchus brandti TaxID=436910 RepID=A0A8F4MZV5_EUCBR|nr:odorant receptor 3 [Eucryptorrhynchus brandti]
MALSQIGMMFTHLVGLGKLWILIVKREQIDDIKKKLQLKQFQYTPLGDFQPGLRMRREKLFSVFIATFMFCLYTFVGVSAHISAVLMVRKNTVGEAFVGNTSCQSFTPYTYWYPFDDSTATHCYYSLIYMDISLDIFAFYIATLDMVFVTLLHVLRTQLNILGEALTTIRGRCVQKLKIESNIHVLHDVNYPKLEVEMYNEFKKCTKHLYSLLDVRNDIEDIFSFIMLIQTLASLLIFASCLFVAARVPLNSPNFFSQLEYFLAVLAQFSVYCWFGNQMTMAGASIPSAIYNSDWFSSSLRFKKMMIFTMMRMQRPLFVSIGKFTPLSLTTLLAVLKGSFSYFTVFQSADNVELTE